MGSAVGILLAASPVRELVALRRDLAAQSKARDRFLALAVRPQRSSHIFSVLEAM